jgi:hypothetical protein
MADDPRRMDDTFPDRRRPLGCLWISIRPTKSKMTVIGVQTAEVLFVCGSAERGGRAAAALLEVGWDSST